MTKATISVLGIDLGKNTCSIAGLHAAGAVVLRRKVTRDGLIAFAATLPPCTIAMERAVVRISSDARSSATGIRSG
jgi:transposase